MSYFKYCVEIVFFILVENKMKSQSKETWPSQNDILNNKNIANI